MFFGIGNSKPFWGIDIGSRSIKGVRLGRTRRGVQILDAAMFEFSDDKIPLSEGIAALLGKSLDKARAAVHFSGRMSPEVRTLMLPVMPKNELLEAVRWEARKWSSLPPEEMVVDYLIMAEHLEDAVKQYEIVVVVVERAALEEQLQAISASGLKVTAVDLAATALLNTARLYYEDHLPENLLYVDIGAQKMEINIVKSGVIRFTRQVAMGGDTITHALSRAATLSLPEAEGKKRKEGIPLDGPTRIAVLEQVDRFIVEIQRSVDYYRAQSRERGIDKILLMGGMPLLPGFLEYFKAFFDAPVELDNAFSKAPWKDPRKSILLDIAPRFSMALGLALRKG